MGGGGVHKGRKLQIMTFIFHEYACNLTYKYLSKVLLHWRKATFVCCPNSGAAS